MMFNSNDYMVYWSALIHARNELDATKKAITFIKDERNNQLKIKVQECMGDTKRFIVKEKSDSFMLTPIESHITNLTLNTPTQIGEQAYIVRWSEAIENDSDELAARHAYDLLKETSMERGKFIVALRLGMTPSIA